MRASYEGTRVLNAAATQWTGTGIATRMKGKAVQNGWCGPRTSSFSILGPWPRMSGIIIWREDHMSTKEHEINALK